MSNDNFKNSPIHDKKSIIDLMDKLNPQDMTALVQFLKLKTEKPKESSIDLLAEKLTKLDLGYKSGNISYTDYLQGRNKAIDEAKEMHKDEIMDAFNLGKWDWSEHMNDGTPSKDPAEYYNREFIKNK